MKKLWKIILSILAVMILIVAVLVQVFGPVYGPLLTGKPIYLVEPKPSRYGQIAFNHMDTMGLYRTSEEWQANREKFEDELGSVTNEEDLLLKLNEAIILAGGKHSFADQHLTEEEMREEYQEPVAKEEANVLYLELPTFAASLDLAQDYADTLMTGLKKANDYQGIIIDLRGNRGGDMGPMLAGLSPLLEDGELLSFVYGENEVPVTLEDGSIEGGGSPISVENIKKIKDLPIAVLIDHDTASSAELTLLALKENENVKTFGEETRGLTSVNQTINLTEDIYLALTIGSVKTRSGENYKEQPIQADVPSQQAKEDALQWIQEMK